MPTLGRSCHDWLVNNPATPPTKQGENDGQTIKATRQLQLKNDADNRCQPDAGDKAHRNTVAAREARATGRNYVVASSPFPEAATYLLAADHPTFAQNHDLRVRYEFIPAGVLVHHDETPQ